MKRMLSRAATAALAAIVAIHAQPRATHAADYYFTGDGSTGQRACRDPESIG